MFGKWFGGAAGRHRSRTRIAFERTGEHIPGCALGVCTIDPDGSGARLIHPAGESPRWSPDGRWIAFSQTTRDNGGLRSVFVMTPDGSDVRQLTHHDDLDATPPSWSPGSHRLAYALWLWKPKRYELRVVDLATKISKPLLQTENSIYPVWSPSGTILFSDRNETGAARLFEVHPDGGRVREAAGFEPGDAEPVWTPDGTRVVFGRDGALGVRDTASGQTESIEPEGTAIQWAIAPDGRAVAYAAQENDEAGFEIYVIELHSRAKRTLVSNPIAGDHEVDSRYVSWSPYL